MAQDDKNDKHARQYTSVIGNTGSMRDNVKMFAQINQSEINNYFEKSQNNKNTEAPNPQNSKADVNRARDRQRVQSAQILPYESKKGRYESNDKNLGARDEANDQVFTI